MTNHRVLSAQKATKGVDLPPGLQNTTCTDCCHTRNAVDSTRILCLLGYVLCFLGGSNRGVNLGIKPQSHVSETKNTKFWPFLWVHPGKSWSSTHRGTTYYQKSKKADTDLEKPRISEYVQLCKGTRNSLNGRLWPRKMQTQPQVTLQEKSAGTNAVDKLPRQESGPSTDTLR